MNKPKTNSKYDGKRLNNSTLKNYLEDTYGEVKLKTYKHIPNIKAFLQNDYGGDGDCTLTAILTVTSFYRSELNINDVYDYIEKIAKKYFYNPKLGTAPFFNKAIVKEVFNHFKIQKPVYSKYLKNIGFNINTIMDEIRIGCHPIILSITKDGRKYYNNHTITIVGYNIYEDINGKEIYMLRVFDN
jgi:hypothetical protein